MYVYILTFVRRNKKKCNARTLVLGLFYSVCAEMLLEAAQDNLTRTTYLLCLLLYGSLKVDISNRYFF